MTLVEVSGATIFCGVAEAERLGALLADREVLEGTAGSMTLPTVAGELAITPLEFDGPGRQFARIILGASNAVRNGIVATTGGQEKVGELLASCDMLLGLRFSPAVMPDDERAELAFALTAEMQGVIFDGVRFMDSAGNPLVEVAP